MAASVIEYYKIILDVAIAAIIAIILILLAKKNPKTKDPDWLHQTHKR